MSYFRSFKIYLIVMSLLSVSSASPMSKNIIVDTDGGPDDLMAIGYLLSHPRASVKAITLAGTGLSHSEKGEENLRLLEALARSKNNIPIGLGPNVTLKDDENPYPPMIREWVDDLLGIQVEPTVSPQEPLQAQLAVQLLSRVIDQHAGNISILCIGALTNIAMLIQQEPEVVKKIKDIVIMGGAGNVPGNAAVLGHPENVTAEMNMLADPFAAQVVLESGAHITLVPLDCTNTVPIDLAFVDRFNKAVVDNNPLMKLISEVFEKLKEKVIAPGHYYAWDPLAAAILMHPELAEYKTDGIQVILEKGSQYGRTIFSPTPQEARKHLVRVAMHPNGQQWESEFIKTLAQYDPVQAFNH